MLDIKFYYCLKIVIYYVIRYVLYLHYNYLNVIMNNSNKVSTIPNSYSVLDELIPISIDMIESNVKGTYNFTNTGKLTDDHIMKMYKKIVDPDVDWKTCNKDHKSNAVFDVSLLELNYKICCTKVSVERALERMKLKKV